MKPASTTFKNNLVNYNSWWVSDLIQITLLDGTVLRYCDFESDVTLSGITYSSAGPYPIFSGFQQKIGTEVDECKVQLWALLTNLVESTAILEAIGQGLFDGADVVIQRVMMPNPNDGSTARPIKFDTSAGGVTVFHGNISDIVEVDRTHAEFDVKSRKELLNIPFPYQTFQPSCRWPLYGAGCNILASSFVVAGAVSGTPNPLLFNSNLTNADGYFSEGTITFTSGVNNGLSRTVRLYAHASGQILLWLALPAAPAAADTFNIYPGCDHTFSTCVNKFANGINFGGEDMIPPAEVAI